MYRKNWLLFCLSITGMLVTGLVNAAVPSKQHPIIVVPEIKHDLSLPLRNAPMQTQEQRSSEPLRVVPLFHFDSSLIGATSKTPKGVDTALQTLAPIQLNIPVQGFQGIGVGLGTFRPNAAPPDTNGAAGLTQYVQWVNSSFAVFDKQTGAVLPGYPKAGNSIWQGFGGLCETTNRGDPIVRYDQLANRWVMTQFAWTDFNTGPFIQCVAVSTSGDATGTYNRYAFQFTGFNDYAKLGVWPDAYYITFNIFGGPVSGPLACAMDRTRMLTGLSATMQCARPVNSGSILPADLDGKVVPAAGTPEYFLTFINSNTLNLYKFHVDFSLPSNSAFTGPISIPVSNFIIASSVTQPITSTQLESLSDRLMYRLAYRQFSDHGSILANHAIVGPSSTAAIRWYEIRVDNATLTPVLYQQGTFSPDANNRFMGSIAMDKSGNIAVGFSESSSSLYPSISFAARTPSDPLGTFSLSQRLVTGTGSQVGLTRWGDYSSMTIDPVDDCTFWYTNEYLQTTGAFNWSTFINHFAMPGCGTTPPPPLCTRANPTVMYFPNTPQTIPQNGTLTVNFTVTNNDSAACTASTFNLTPTVSSSLIKAGVNPSSLSIAPGNSDSGYMIIKSSNVAVIGQSYSATLQISDPALLRSTSFTSTVFIGYSFK